ncbi:MAG: vWA domain-containing protein, partial [Granulosicoccaceae bacterium]
AHLRCHREAAMSGVAVEYPWLLSLGLLMFLPWRRYWVVAHEHPDTRLLQNQSSSHYLSIVIRLAASLAVAALLLGLAGLHKPLSRVPQVGKGAHVVIALDRSRSMDQAFAEGKKSLAHAARLKAASKGQVAREVMSAFIQSRAEDMFAFVAFSTQAIPVVELTRKQELLSAAIDAGGIGRGLGDTNIGAGLLQALSLFEGQPFSGSRIVLLVSDGAAHLDSDTRRQIRELALQYRVALYWLYIRTANGPDIFDTATFIEPEVQLHRFFQRLPTPYRGYSAERPSDLAQAVADIDQLQNLPLNYEDLIPRQDLSRWCFVVASLLLLLLALVEYLVMRSVQEQPIGDQE